MGTNTARCVAIEMKTASKEEKADVAMQCGVTWACKSPCARDYTEPCPLRWTKAFNTVRTCEPPDPDGKSANFVNYNKFMMMDYEMKHPDVRWPCLVPTETWRLQNGPLTTAQAIKLHVL